MQPYISSQYFWVGGIDEEEKLILSLVERRNIEKWNVKIAINCKFAAWPNGAKVRRSKNNLLDE